MKYRLCVELEDPESCSGCPALEMIEGSKAYTHYCNAGLGGLPNDTRPEACPLIMVVKLTES